LSSLKHLTHLDLSFSCITNHLLFSLANQALPLRNLVLQGCCGYTYTGISYFLSKSRFLQHLDLQNTKFLNDHIFSELCVFLGNLVSINVSGCRRLTNSALFAILRNSPLLSEIRMESTKIGIGCLPRLDLVVNHQLKSLHLAYNSHLRDGVIYMFSFMFPNMQLLDLSSCCGISGDSITEVLKRCPKIRGLNLAFFPQPKLFLINFDVPKLEVLNLSHSRIDDEVLYAISNFCPQLQQLNLERCYGVTEKGVRLLVEKCTHLREINLRYCCKVSTNIVAWMIFSRPSLRKIMAPPHFRPCDDDKKLLFRRCLVC
jgi:F-box/leucine-rich repeat protein 2/20